MKNICVYILILSGLFFSGCATPGYTVENSNYSIKQHRIAITAAFGLVKDISQNGRTVSSMYHDREFKTVELTPKTKARLYSKATVLGAIRPYKISIQVLEERKDPDTRQWIVVENHIDLAEKRAEIIQSLLNQSRDDGGTFDEEAPF
jgi:hypothetical protein